MGFDGWPVWLSSLLPLGDYHWASEWFSEYESGAVLVGFLFVDVVSHFEVEGIVGFVE